MSATGSVGEACGTVGPAARSKVWPPERLEHLAQLIEAGLSAAAIGEALGCSRSAVLGIASRSGLKLTGRRLYGGRTHRAEAPAAVRATPKPSGAKPSGARAIVSAPRAMAPIVPALIKAQAPRPQPAVPPIAGCGLIELTAESCRWPVGEVGAAGFHFCAVPVDVPGLDAYCAEHRARAYAPRRDAMSRREAVNERSGEC